MALELARLERQLRDMTARDSRRSISDLGRFYDRIVTVSARLERNSRPNRFRGRVELVANVRRGHVLVANVHREGLRSALDDAVHTLQWRLSRHHDKVELERRRRRS